ncbi:TIGR02186 family protein [Roseitranquillus sediminis]|uniref:TIGR02186 family protein n=1 Tax=Roseitranquillus sediminis TaxID=2809051 RepID=UPI001D0C794F|nr:TIGR02186 family protein [Roseitranquillus sediminis]MBM9595283.1 TIGR02186 family protein [Roseitranquillus sediminis]
MRWLVALLIWAVPAAAEEVVADLSQNRISITADFDGSEILIFGAVKREEPLEGVPLEVVITLSGPSQTVMVRRKSRVAAIWANTAAVEVDRAPSFYAVATSGPLSQVLSQTEDLRHRITTRRAIRAVGAPQEVLDLPEFVRALIRVREGAGQYQLREGAVSVREQTLFSTSIELPANLVEGNYEVRIFLTREGHVINAYDTVIYVQKVGLEKFLYVLAHERPFIYGLMSLALAGVAGWGASAAFRWLRP